MLKAGYGQVEITPTGPVPLGGYFTLRDRISEGLRDPLFVRALAFDDGKTRFVLVVYDLLLISEQMVQGLRSLLGDAQASVLLCATHTHSAPGGFWDTFVARLALGGARPGMLSFLVDAGARAARAALGDLAPATWAVHTDRIPSLAKNRRDKAGPVDPGLWTLRISRARKGGDLLLVGFPGHPVIVAERAFKMVSADFPGEVVRRLEAIDGVAHAVFVNGALGGVDVFFPEAPIGADENLALQAAPIAEAAAKVLAAGLRQKGRLAFASHEEPLPARTDVRPMFDDQPRWAAAVAPLARLAGYAFSRARIDRYRLQGFALDEAVFVGAPADLGVSVSLAIQEAARARGFAAPFVASQCDGYIGYLHRRDDYRRAPSKETLGMAIYENVMGMFGREMGERLLVAASRLLGELADERT